LAAGRAGNRSAASNSAQATVTGSQPDDQIPQAPTQLRLVQAGKTSLDISWSAVSNVVIRQYHVYRDGDYVTSVTRPQLHDNWLQSGTQYRYYLIAEDVKGQFSAPSVSLNAKTVSEELPAPGGEEWKSGVSYKPGDVVNYQGKQYRCLQGHPGTQPQRLHYGRP
jgi:chitodextrinase